MKMRAGDVVHLTTDASVQFLRPISVRIIRELPERITYDGWVWIEGYELDAAGDARARRELYVRREGVQLVQSAPPATPTRPTTRRPVVRTPLRAG
ncbi:hypothetical protein AB0A95_16550 [Micromonospora sp. NPDC049230]|uniref:hypothetical protein n=1 Tax=Micromonospora sp. NPDC049230 TaxID=3155502 RepID=UPI0034038947